MCLLRHCIPRTTFSSLLTSTWFLTHHIPLHMSLFDVTYARSHPPGYLLWFHLHFLPFKQLSYLDANSATDTFCSTLMSCFDTFCPLSSSPARTTPSAPWLSVVLREHRSKLRAAERVWRKSQNPTDLNFYRSLLPDFYANVSTAKRTYYHDKINNLPNTHMLFKTFSSLLCPPPPPPSSTLSADDFGTFFINKITNLTAQFYTPQSVKHINCQT